MEFSDMTPNVRSKDNERKSNSKINKNFQKSIYPVGKKKLTFSKKDYIGLYQAHANNVQRPQLLGKYKFKPQQDITTQLLEQL